MRRRRRRKGEATDAAAVPKGKPRARPERKAARGRSRSRGGRFRRRRRRHIIRGFCLRLLLRRGRAPERELRRRRGPAEPNEGVAGAAADPSNPERGVAGAGADPPNPNEGVAGAAATAAAALEDAAAFPTESTPPTGERLAGAAPNGDAANAADAGGAAGTPAPLPAFSRSSFSASCALAYPRWPSPGTPRRTRRSPPRVSGVPSLSPPSIRGAEPPRTRAARRRRARRRRRRPPQP